VTCGGLGRRSAGRRAAFSEAQRATLLKRLFREMRGWGRSCCAEGPELPAVKRYRNRGCLRRSASRRDLWDWSSRRLASMMIGGRGQGAIDLARRACDMRRLP